jgi:tetratricopeptide (TPR) repeat protein
MFRRSTLMALAFACALFAADPAVEQAKKKITDKKYDEAITQLEGAYKAKQSPEVKKALADANMAKGDAFMNDESVPPRVKYPTALRAYREVLKYEKDNKKAQSQIATIEGIYKSMGRPVPQ